MPIFGRKKSAVPQEIPIAVAIGKRVQIELYENRIRVKGGVERDVFIPSISAVVLGPAGRFSDGWLTLHFAGREERTIVGDSNEFGFNRKQQPAFEHLRDELNKLIARQTP